MSILKKKNENKYLIFNSVDENKELLKKHSDVWNVIKKKIKGVNDSECLKFHNMTITTRSVFEEDGKLYPQLFLDDFLYELTVSIFFNKFLGIYKNE